MSADFQKKYFEKSHYVPNLFSQKNIDIVNNSKK